jgi:hypothetical protein
MDLGPGAVLCPAMQEVLLNDNSLALRIICRAIRVRQY